jgi:glycosyltransferase 2 family protein
MSQNNSTQTAEPRHRRFVRAITSWPARLIGTATCLWILFSHIDVGHALKLLVDINPTHVVIGFFATLGVLLCSLAEWGVLVRSAADVSWAKLSHAYFKSLAPMHLIPTGIGGDASKIYSLSSETRTAAATAATLVARLGSTTAMIFWALLASIRLDVWWAVSASAIALVIMFGVWLMALMPNFAAFHAARFAKRFSKRKAPRAVLHFANELKDLRANRSAIILSFCFSLVGWGLQYWTLSFLAAGAGIDIGWFLFAVALPFSLIATLAPFALNGYGLREGILVGIFVHDGIAASSAAAVALLVDLQMVPFIALSALMWLQKRKKESGSAARSQLS